MKDFLFFLRVNLACGIQKFGVKRGEEEEGEGKLKGSIEMRDSGRRLVSWELERDEATHPGPLTTPAYKL